ncbi:MAG TPA: ABC transporter ATP-binding protein [Chthoniobacteraceae bacterium]|jgi:ABC-type lipoprotein export system ATPase subunit
MLVELRHVSKAYRAPDGGDAVNVLGDVSLEIEAGQTVAIVGPSGSGKSTVLNLVGALDRVDSGEVIVAGQDVRKLGERELSAYRSTTVGFIFQLHHLLPQCTILENVLVPTLALEQPDTQKLHARAEALLASVGLQHRLHHRPGELSGGERQRAAVARALINSPKLLLADEPTGALDRVNAARLADLLVDVNREQSVAIIMVTHAPDLAQRMGRVLELVDGKLVEAPR